MLGRTRKQNAGTFFEWMQKRAARKGLHLRALADLIGADDSSFYHWCHHPEQFRCLTAAQCAHHLEISREEIVDAAVNATIKLSD